METDTQTHLESLVELGLSSTVSTILTQSSTEIYKVLHEYTSVHLDCLKPSVYSESGLYQLLI